MKIMKKIATILTLFLLIVGTTACDDMLDDGVTTTAPKLSLVYPDGMEGMVIESERIEVKNISTGRSIIYTDQDDIELRLGLYDISYEAEMTDGNGDRYHLIGYQPSVTLTPTSRDVSIQLYQTVYNNDFIIQEVFFTGTLQSSGNSYVGDDYIKIYNNTDHVLYADGLSIVESKFVTTEKYDYDPDVMNEAMTVHAIYTIPGSGKEHPVQPGESLLICDTGIDHRTANPNSFDLSGADFEWYDVSTQPAHLDIDGPTVPNLDKWYCYTQSFFMLHNRGFKAWALARIPIDKDQYLANYLYRYNYTMVLPAGTFPMSQTAYKLPNAWIVDAVNCSVASNRAWNVTSPELDRGWAHCGEIDKDRNRFFHSVRRKLLFVKDGMAIYQDTNNSSADFNSDVVASEIELQGTVISANGTKATTVTYDGVTPVNPATPSSDQPK